MNLVSFSVTKYRSIVKASTVPLARSTVLIGPNNEGKSNILRALVSALELLSRIGGTRVSRGRLRSTQRLERFYVWERDFPVSLQDTHPAGESVFRLEFRLSSDEVAEFERHVRSKLNGTLPVELYVGRGDEVGFKVLKKGPGGPALSKKAEAVASFISKRINLSYIPAVRTSESARDIVVELVEKELAVVETSTEYQDALKAVADIQQPVLDKISESIRDTLQEFLPNIATVQVSIPQQERTRALRTACEIVIDDGSPTELMRKGDGVQSLAALGLMRHASVRSGAGRNLILAIEEPESHLHPRAVHQLRKVIADIATKHQVIMTTHCPLFVDRVSIKSNIIVHQKKAQPAKNVKEIRDILGVRASDNLQHAELLLIVEGEEDRTALKSLLGAHSKRLASAFSQQSLGIESLQGGCNLSYKLSQVREALCNAHSFLDHDDCGLKAFQRAEQDGLLEIADVTFTMCDGQKESEIEDLYEESLYSAMLLNKYGVSVQSPKFKGKGKWSDRMGAAFRHQGKPWSDLIKAKVKYEVAELAAASPLIALNAHKKTSFDALVGALEAKLSAPAPGRT